MVQVVTAVRIIVLGIDLHTMEFRGSFAEAAGKRLRPLQFHDGAKTAPRVLMEAAHIEKPHLDVSLVGEHVVIICPARTHRIPRLQVALLGDQDVLKDCQIEAVEHRVRHVEPHSRRDSAPPVAERFIEARVKSDAVHLLLLGRQRHCAKRNLDAENFSPVSGH